MAVFGDGEEKRELTRLVPMAETTLPRVWCLVSAISHLANNSGML